MNKYDMISVKKNLATVVLGSMMATPAVATDQVDCNMGYRQYSSNSALSLLGTATIDNNVEIRNLRAARNGDDYVSVLSDRLCKRGENTGYFVFRDQNIGRYSCTNTAESGTDNQIAISFHSVPSKKYVNARVKDGAGNHLAQVRLKHGESHSITYRRDDDTAVNFSGSCYIRQNRPINAFAYPSSNPITSLQAAQNLVNSSNQRLDYQPASINFTHGNGQLSDFLANGRIQPIVSPLLSQQHQQFVHTLKTNVYLEAGARTVAVTHDDGVRVTLGGTQVVNFTGETPSVQTNSTFQAPTSRFYALEVLYFQNAGGSTLKVEIDGKLVDVDNFNLQPDP